MKSHHSRESLPDFHFTPRTLQDIASSQYAFVCWCNCSDLPHIPASIRSMIDNKIQSIGKEIRKWKYSNQRSFGDVPREVMINCVAFNSAGGICSGRTAKNLLMSNWLGVGFDAKKQFEIACAYCIEEDVERLWPLVKDDERFREYRFDILSHPSIFKISVVDYWCSRMRGELKKLSGPEAKSPEWYALSRLLPVFYVKNWAEVEYFWSKLNTQERTSLVDRIWMLRESTKYMIMKSNDTVLRNLVRTEWFRLIPYFVEDDTYSQYALQLWNYGKSSIVKGDTFCDILYGLSHVAYKREYKYVTTLLEEIWLSAPADHLKDYVSAGDGNADVESLFSECLEEAYIQSFGRGFGFLIELLKGASFEIRERVWLTWWLKFTLVGKVSDLRELMTLCFDNVNDIVEFKKTEMLDYRVMRHNFEDHVRKELFEELSEYLMFCCSDADDEKQARVVRTRIILRNIGWIMQHDSDLTWCKFFQFFDGCFTLAEAAELLECQLPDKETGLLSLWISFCGFKTFDRMLRCLKFSDQRLMELKKFFNERCRHVFTCGDFNTLKIDDWDNFLKWCGFSPEELSELKCNVRIENLFENFLIKMYKLSVTWRNCRDSLVGVCYEEINFDSIDGFLRWYFESEEAVKEFKSRKMNDHENSEAIKLFSKADRMGRLFFESWSK